MLLIALVGCPLRTAPPSEETQLSRRAPSGVVATVVSEVIDLGHGFACSTGAPRYRGTLWVRVGEEAFPLRFSSASSAEEAHRKLRVLPRLAFSPEGDRLALNLGDGTPTWGVAFSEEGGADDRQSPGALVACEHLRLPDDPGQAVSAVPPLLALAARVLETTEHGALHTSQERAGAERLNGRR